MLESLAFQSTCLPVLPAQGDDEADCDFICRPINIPSALTKAECSAITELGRHGHGVTAGLTHPIEGYRTGVTRIIPADADGRWIYERVGSILRINQWYRFDVTGSLNRSSTANIRGVGASTGTSTVAKAARRHAR